MATYILTNRDDRYWLVGPFESHEVANSWNSFEANNPGDDPRWQVIDLDNPHASPVVLSPDQASMTAERNAR